MNIKGFVEHFSVLSNIIVLTQCILLVCKVFSPIYWIIVLSPSIILFFLMVYMCLFIDRNTLIEIVEEVKRQVEE